MRCTKAHWLRHPLRSTGVVGFDQQMPTQTIRQTIHDQTTMCQLACCTNLRPGIGEIEHKALGAPTQHMKRGSAAQKPALHHAPPLLPAHSTLEGCAGGTEPVQPHVTQEVGVGKRDFGVPQRTGCMDPQGAGAALAGGRLDPPRGGDFAQGTPHHRADSAVAGVLFQLGGTPVAKPVALWDAIQAVAAPVHGHVAAIAQQQRVAGWTILAPSCKDTDNNDVWHPYIASHLSSESPSAHTSHGWSPWYRLGQRTGLAKRIRVAGSKGGGERTRVPTSSSSESLGVGCVMVFFSIFPYCVAPTIKHNEVRTSRARRPRLRRGPSSESSHMSLVSASSSVARLESRDPLSLDSSSEEALGSDASSDASGSVTGLLSCTTRLSLMGSEMCRVGGAGALGRPGVRGRFAAAAFCAACCAMAALAACCSFSLAEVTHRVL